MSRLENLIPVLSRPRYLLASLLLFLVFLPILAITSGFFVLKALDFNPTAEPLRIGLILLISILFSLNGAVIFHNHEKRAPSAAKSGFLGAGASLFTVTACPICQPAWFLVFFGFGSATAFLAEASIYLGLASAALLSFSLYSSLKNSDACEIGKQPKNRKQSARQKNK